MDTTGESKPGSAWFDAGEDYERQLNRGLKLSGESKEYFILGRLLRLFRLLADPDEFARVLDFGCGTGETSGHIARCLPSARVVGFDPSEGAIRFALAGQAGADERIRFSSSWSDVSAQQFDLVYTNGVFHHIPPCERPQVLARLFEVLRPGGHLALFENNPWNPATHLVMRRIPFDPGAVKISPRQALRLTRSAGFEVARAPEYLFVFPRALRICRPLERLLHRIPAGAQYLVLASRPLRDT